MKLVRCDRCRKEVPQPIGLPVPAGTVPVKIGAKEHDLCPPCADALVRWIADPPPTAARGTS